MTNTTHTPGPWLVSRNYIRVHADKECIAEIIGNEKNRQANARLIAAAPDLLAFAKLVAAGHLTKEGFIESAQRIIAKTEGK